MEKRVHHRIPSDLKIKLCLDDEMNPATIVNVSNKGMFINTKVNFPIQSQFEILLPVGDEMLKLPVRVSRLSKKDNTYDGIGVELIDPPQRFLDFIEKQLREKERRIKTFLCRNCNFTSFGQAPIQCPFCRGSIDNFDDSSGGVKTVENFPELSDFEKAHFPVIDIVREENTGREQRHFNIHVKVGEVHHRMDIDDRINFIDFYFNDLSLNKKCIARVNLNCHIVRPEATLRFYDTSVGTLTVVSNCSLHGSWMSKTQIGVS